MKATQMLHELGQSLWLDNITRDMLRNGTLKLYVDVTSAAYNAAIHQKLKEGKTGEAKSADLGTASKGP